MARRRTVGGSRARPQVPLDDAAIDLAGADLEAANPSERTSLSAIDVYADHSTSFCPISRFAPRISAPASHLSPPSSHVPLKSPPSSEFYPSSSHLVSPPTYLLQSAPSSEFSPPSSYSILPLRTSSNLLLLPISPLPALASSISSDLNSLLTTCLLDTKQLDAFKNKLNKVIFKRKEGLTTLKIAAKTLRAIVDPPTALLTSDKLRHYTPLVRRQDGSWVLVAIASPDDDNGHRCVAVLPIDRCSHLSVQDLEQLCERLVDQLNRWPSTLDAISCADPPQLDPDADDAWLKLKKNRNHWCLGMMNIIFEAIASTTPFDLVPERKSVRMPHAYGNQSWWEGKKFVRIVLVRPYRTIRLEPSTSLASIIENGTLPAISLQSLDKARLLPVLDIGANVLWHTRDPREAWLALAIAVETQRYNIREAIPSSNVCQCEDEMSTTCVHHCADCLQEFTNNVLTFGSDGLRLCPPCLGKDAKRDGLADAILWKSLSTSLERNFARIGVDSTESYARDVAEEALADLRTRFTLATPGFMDEYRQKPCSVAPEKEGTWVRDPRLPSVDAIWPYHFEHRVAHCAGNLAVTLLCENYAKWVYIPGILEEVKDFFVVHEAIMDKERLSPDDAFAAQQATDRLLEACSRFTTLVVKAKYQKEHHDKADFTDPERITLEMQEWLTGRVRDDEVGPWNVTTYAPAVQQRPRYPELNAKLLWFAEQFEAEFDVLVPRSQDGCPWFGHTQTLDKWSWSVAWGEMNTRFHRMKLLCNGYWVTEDTAFTLYIECLFQYCARSCAIERLRDTFWSISEKRAFQLQYREFLGLPLLFQAWHPLNFSIAHKLHGRQMRTGWTMEPETLNDRNDALNNILCETRFTNSLKHNFPTIDYEFLLEVIRSINMPKHLYDPQGRLDPLPEDLHLDWNAVEPVTNLEDEISAIQGTPVVREDEHDNEDGGDDVGPPDATGQLVRDVNYPKDRCHHPECSGKTFSKSSNLTTHLRSIHGEDKNGQKLQTVQSLKCHHPECSGKTFVSSDRLTRHLREVHGEDKDGQKLENVPTFVCHYLNCKRQSLGFGRPETLQRHLRAVHGDMGKISQYPCPDCSTVFVDAHARESHRRTHLDTEASDHGENEPTPPRSTGLRLQDPIIRMSDMVAIAAMHAKFPDGWEVLPTSSTGFYCLFYAFIRSIEAQYPEIPIPDIDNDLKPWLDSEEMAYAQGLLNICREFAKADAPNSSEAKQTNRGHLLFDHGMYAIYL